MSSLPSTLLQGTRNLTIRAVSVEKTVERFEITLFSILSVSDALEKLK